MGIEVEMRDVDILPAVAVHIRSVNAHTRFVAAVFAGCQAGNHGNILKSPIMLVDEEKTRPGVVGDGDVRPGIVVEGGEYDSHALGFGLADTRSVTYVSEGAVVIIVIERGLLAFVVAGIAVGAVAGTTFATPQIRLRSPLDVIGYHEIEPTILVVVKPSCAGGPLAFIRKDRKSTRLNSSHLGISY